MWLYNANVKITLLYGLIQSFVVLEMVRVVVVPLLVRPRPH